MKITRRKMATAVLASSAASLAQTQRTAPAIQDDELKAARDRLRSNAEALATEKIPMATEPAFQFKA